MSELVLSDLLHDASSPLFRDGEGGETPSTGKKGLFTWRPGAKKKEEEEAPADKHEKSAAAAASAASLTAANNAAAASSASASSSSIAPVTASTPSRRGGLFTLRGKSKKEDVAAASPQGIAALERLSYHKHGVRSLVSVPNEPGEVWTLDEAGVVARWNVEKPGKSPKNNFTATGHGGHAMAVCGKSVWIGSGDVTEIRDFSARLMWKLLRYSSCFVEHSSMDAVWCGGNDGAVALYKQESSLMTVQLTYRPLVTAIAVLANPATGESELWVAQGRGLTVVNESSGKLLGEFPALVENRINVVVESRGTLLLGCDDGKIVRINPSDRSAVQTIQAIDGACWSLVAGSSRIWACGTGRNVRLFDVEKGTPLETIANAHEEGGVTGLLLVESSTKLLLWTIGSDRHVGVWNAGTVDSLVKSNNTPVLSVGREESDEFEESDASVDRSGGSGSSSKTASLDLATASRSPRMVQVSERSPRLAKFSIGSATQAVSSNQAVRIGGDDEMEEDDGGSGKKKKGKKRIVSKLFLAAQAGNVEKLTSVMASIDSKSATEEERLEARRKALDTRGPQRRTPLHAAAASGKVECVQALLDWGANIALKDKSDMYALNVTTATDVKALLTQRHLSAGLDLGASTNSSKSRHGRTKSVAVSGSERKSSSGGISRRPVTKKSIPSSGVSLSDGSASKSASSDKPASASASDDASKATAFMSPRTSISSPSVASPRISDSSVANAAPEVEAPPAERKKEEIVVAATEREVNAAVRIQAYMRMKSARAELLQLQIVRTKRKNIGVEMLKTEETYVKTLDILVNKIRVSMSTQSFRTAAGGVSEQDMKIIFPASLSMLLSAHESWLAQLNVRIQQWTPQQCVGDLFLQLSPYLKMYIVYVSNFELSTLKIRELKKREKSRFAELVHEVFVNLGDPTNDLASMLVTPVQRIPRYLMLVKDLLKYTSPQHPDYNNLIRAVKIMTDTTILVDRKAEDAKNAQKVLEVADSIVESPLSIVQPNRKWVRDGAVGLVVGANDVKPRYAFLFSDVLVLCTVVEPIRQSSKKAEVPAVKLPTQYKFQREISLLAATVNGIKDEEGGLCNLLAVRSPKLTFVLQATSAADKASWIKGLVSVIELRKEGNQSRIAATARGSGAGNDMLSRSSAAVVMSSGGGTGSSKGSDSMDDDTASGRTTGGVDESEGSIDKSGSVDRSNDKSK